MDKMAGALKTDLQLSEGPIFIIDLARVMLSEAGKMTRIPLAMIGTFHQGKKKFTITRDDIAAMAENFSKRGNGEVVLDYEHASEMPEVAQGGPIPAAGWIKAVDREPDANRVVWGEAELTAKAREMVAAGEIKYISPVIHWGERDKRTGGQQGATLMSAAMTNTPFLDQMPAIRLSDAWTEDEKGESMATKKAACPDHPDAQVLCSECDAEKFNKVAASEHQHGPKVIQLSEVKRDGKGRLDLSSLTNDAVVSFAVIRAADAERVALSEVADAAKEGKILPAQREGFERLALSNIENFRSIVKTMKPQVDLGERGVAGTGAEAGAGTELQKTNLRLSEMATARASKDNIPFGKAMRLVASENPELARQRTRLARKVQTGGDE